MLNIIYLKMTKLKDMYKYTHHMITYTDILPKVLIEIGKLDSDNSVDKTIDFNTIHTFNDLDNKYSKQVFQTICSSYDEPIYVWFNTYGRHVVEYLEYIHIFCKQECVVVINNTRLFGWKNPDWSNISYDKIEQKLKSRIQSIKYIPSEVYSKDRMVIKLYSNDLSKLRYRKIVLLHSKNNLPHPKNNDNFIRMCKSMNLEYEITADKERISQDNYDILVAYNEFIEPELVPVRIKIVYGPGMFVFPSGPLVGPLRKELVGRCVYNTLSDWNKKVHEEMAESMIVPLVTFPYSIETDYFIPSSEPKTLDCILYVKSRENRVVNYVTNLLNEKGLNYRLFKYGSYNGHDYKMTLPKAKFMITLDAHESQGFAIQEAMSSNIPLLVCDIKSLFDNIPDGENPNILRKDYMGKKLYASSVPYWSEECGMKLDSIFDLDSAIDIMLQKYNTFSPRKFIVENLSNEVCMKRILDYFNFNL